MFLRHATEGVRTTDFSQLCALCALCLHNWGCSWKQEVERVLRPWQARTASALLGPWSLLDAVTASHPDLAMSVEGDALQVHQVDRGWLGGASRARGLHPLASVEERDSRPTKKKDGRSTTPQDEQKLRHFHTTVSVHKHKRRMKTRKKAVNPQSQLRMATLRRRRLSSEELQVADPAGCSHA